MRTFGDVLKVPFKDLYEMSSMQTLADQLFYGVRKGRRVIKMARRGNLAPGVLMYKRGMKFAPGPGFAADFGKQTTNPTPTWKPPASRKTVGDTYVVRPERGPPVLCLVETAAVLHLCLRDCRVLRLQVHSDSVLLQGQLVCARFPPCVEVHNTVHASDAESA
jgi:hypothetical protein